MSDLNEDIDHLFQEIIEPSEMKPSKTVWTSIDQKLNDKQYGKLQKKYKRIMNFSIGISLMVISLLYLIFNQNTKKKDFIVKDNVSNNQTTSITVPSEKTEVPISSEASGTTNLVERNSVANNNTVKNSMVNSDNNVVAKQNDLVPADGALTKTVTNESVPDSNEDLGIVDSSVPPIEKLGSITVDNNKTEGNETSTGINNERVSTPEDLEINNRIPENNNLTASIDKNDAVVSVDNALIKPTLSDVSSIVSNKSGEKENTNEPDMQNVLKNESENKTQEILNETTIKEQKEIIPASEKADSIKFTNTSIDTTNTSITDFNNPPNTDNLWKDYKLFIGAVYSPDRVTTKPNYINGDGNKFIERNKFSYSTGIKFGYQFTKHWSVTANIIYSSISSSFDFNRVITSYKITTDCSWFTSYGTVTIPVTNSVSDSGVPPKYTSKINVTGIEKINYLSIPVEGQYSLGKKQLSGFVSVGFAANFLISQKAVVNDLVSNVQYNSNVSGLQKIYFNSTLGIGIQYRITQHIRVFIEPTYRRSLTPINKDMPYKTYPSILAVNGGLNFFF